MRRFDSVQYRKVEVVRSSYFRHVFGKPVKAEECLTGVTPSRSAADSTWEERQVFFFFLMRIGVAPLIACSASHLAVVLEAPNGKLLVVNNTRTGRLTPATKDVTLETGSAVYDMAFSRYQGAMYAVAQDNGHVTVWELRQRGQGCAAAHAIAHAAASPTCTASVATSAA